MSHQVLRRFQQQPEEVTCLFHLDWAKTLNPRRMEFCVEQLAAVPPL